MVITEKKPIEEIFESLKEYNKIFLLGCGECATSCKTGGEEEVLSMKKLLEKNNYIITGYTVAQAPCISGKLKIDLISHSIALKQTEAILILACGLGVQSVRIHNRFNCVVLPACDTIFLGVTDQKGDLYEYCRACGECLIGSFAGICPVTLCAKGLLNGPCGGSDRGKCEVDRDKDCAWALIYNELESANCLQALKKIQQPRNHSKALHPKKKIFAKA